MEWQLLDEAFHRCWQGMAADEPFFAKLNQHYADLEQTEGARVSST